jgi:adenosylcobalamin-dependent ribonucleoside-diphosphate reductase
MSNSNTLNAVEQTIETPTKTVDESLRVDERLTENAAYGILPARYLQKDESGDTTEGIVDMFTRVAENVAAGEASEVDEEKWADEFYKQMSELRFMPNSPTLMNAGTDMNQLSACFVLEPEDDMEDIFKSAQDAALVFQSGGGVGYSFSDLRPKGAYIGSTGGEASGPVSFMRVFDETCNQVKQGGKRRGAQMGILRVDHPDVGRFAVSKRIEGEFENFNISVGYTDEFVEAVENDETFTLYDPTTDYEEPYTVREETAKFYNSEYASNPEDAYDDGEGAIVDDNLWRDYADEITTTDGQTLSEKWAGNISLDEGERMELPAEFLWDILVDGAWQNGEPGLFHLDETNREHSFDAEEYPKHEINATNPCAEQPLSEYEACNLGHINLSLILEDDAETYNSFKESASYRGDDLLEYLSRNIDYSNLDRTIEAGVRFLDNVVTQSDFPIDEIEERVSGQRKIGLGIMGFAQMLYQMGIPYGSEESYEVARAMMRYIDRKGTDVSHSIAKERGSFDYWNESKYADPERYSEWFESHTGLPAEDYPEGYAIRNHNVTTIAPTGTTSMIANTSGGCEPVYNVANFKNVGNDIQGDDVLVEFDDYFLETLRANDLDVEAVKQEAESLMRENEFDGVDDLSIPEELKEIFVTTQDLSSRQHGLMQRAFQEYCDSGISKTVNLANDATRDDVADAYKLAFEDEELGAPIKGLTVYRDGSRNEQVLTTRMDNGLDDDEDVDEDLLKLYLQGEISETAAEKIGIEVEDGGAAGCPKDDCDGTLQPTDDCSMCDECFHSPCA